MQWTFQILANSYNCESQICKIQVAVAQPPSGGVIFL